MFRSSRITAFAGSFPQGLNQISKQSSSTLSHIRTRMYCRAAHLRVTRSQISMDSSSTLSHIRTRMYCRAAHLRVTRSQISMDSSSTLSHIRTRMYCRAAHLRVTRSQISMDSSSTLSHIRTRMYCRAAHSGRAGMSVATLAVPPQRAGLTTWSTLMPYMARLAELYDALSA